MALRIHSIRSRRLGHPYASDSHEHEGYAHDLDVSNFENDLQAAADVTFELTAADDYGREARPLTGSLLPNLNNDHADIDRLVMDRLATFIPKMVNSQAPFPIPPPRARQRW